MERAVNIAKLKTACEKSRRFLREAEAEAVLEVCEKDAKNIYGDKAVAVKCASTDLSRVLSAIRKPEHLMPRDIIDITDKTFGRLTARHIAPRPQGTPCNSAFWYCECSCGGVKVANSYTLRKGSTRSCGCLVGDARRARPRRGK